MRKGMIAAAVLLAACSKGETYTARGEVDTTRDTTKGINVPDINLGMKKDTILVPTVKMEKDTMVVSKPVVTGRKPVVVSRPTVDVNKKP